MLAALLLRAGRSVSVHEVIASVWGAEYPDTALATVRTYAWRWRKALEEDRTQPGILVSSGDGYRLNVPAPKLDSQFAEQLAADAMHARKSGRPEQARELLSQALDLWEGEPLAGIPGPFAEQQRSRLGELRLALLEERFDLDLQLGRHALAIPDLNAFAAEHPLRERIHGQLMRALYMTGRQADALAAFERLRRTLDDELGVDPGRELRALHQRILENDISLDVPVPPAAEPEPHTAPPVALPRPAAAKPRGPAAGGSLSMLLTPAQLPLDTPDFTGRATVVTAIGQAIGASQGMPVAAVSGMGGVGKTALALRVAHNLKADFADGQIYADLRGSERDPADPGMVLASFLGALGVPAETLPDSLEDRSRLYRSLLDGRRFLVLLDNARDTAQVRPLLPGSAGCAVIITGRSPLFGLPTVAQVDLDVFGPDEALKLLGRIAGAERIAAEPAAALGLVTSCGFLPLAVRIVAARLAARPSWTVQRLTSRLADERRRLAELRIGDLAVDAAFELGYHQLTDEQARAFRLLAAVGGPDVGVAAAAAALDTDEHTAEEILEALVDAAMLQIGTPGRYRYHDLLRDFAQQRAGDLYTGEGAEALDRLLDFLLASAGAAFALVVPGDPIGDALGATRSAGLTFEDRQSARTWVGAEVNGALAAIQAAARYAVDGAGAQRLRMAADLLIALSPFGHEVRYEQVHPVASAVAEAATALGDRRSAGRAHFVSGTMAMQSTRLAESQGQALRAAEDSRQVGDVLILRQALNDLGLGAQFQRRYPEAIDYYDEAIALAREIGHRSGELVTTINAALARVRSGRAAEVVPACEQLLPALRSLADDRTLAYALYVLGLALHDLGRYQEALSRYGECLQVCKAAGIRDREAQAWYRLADTLRATGQAEEAVRHAQAALARCEEVGADRDQGHALVVLGRALADLGDTDAARLRLQEAHSAFVRLKLPDAVDTEQLLDALAVGGG
jgi:DNA-binding SARP family transcriptional activator